MIKFKRLLAILCISISMLSVAVADPPPPNPPCPSLTSAKTGFPRYMFGHWEVDYMLNANPFFQLSIITNVTDLNKKKDAETIAAKVIENPPHPQGIANFSVMDIYWVCSATKGNYALVPGVTDIITTGQVTKQ